MGFSKKKDAQQTRGIGGMIVDRLKLSMAGNQIPTTDTESEGFAARDNMRRLVKRANGRDSTIRTSAAGALYTAQPQKLLGS